MNLKLWSTGLFLEILNLKGRDQFVHMIKHQFILGISPAPFLRSPMYVCNEPTSRQNSTTDTSSKGNYNLFADRVNRENSTELEQLITSKLP